MWSVHGVGRDGFASTTPNSSTLLSLGQAAVLVSTHQLIGFIGLLMVYRVFELFWVRMLEGVCAFSEPCNDMTFND
ncbi:hypothetical protein V6N12_018701 [Hibiscus sabdariffa]|uniref:Uncharacterized protein n=1 Tax=Hibiscus sabdariffa TaxID=183260 RepID=A0ABR1ZRT3_9ROSI